MTEVGLHTAGEWRANRRKRNPAHRLIFTDYSQEVVVSKGGKKRTARTNSHTHSHTQFNQGRIFSERVGGQGAGGVRHEQFFNPGTRDVIWTAVQEVHNLFSKATKTNRSKIPELKGTK